MADKKPDHEATVLRLWKGGERKRAIEYAEANKVKEANWPDGMSDHKELAFPKG